MQRGPGDLGAAAPGHLAETGFTIWTGKWEVNDLPQGYYAVEVTAKDKDGKVITQRTDTIYHGDKSAPKDKPRERLQQETPKGRREKLSLGTLFIPDGLKTDGPVPLFVHFHSVAWIPEVAASRQRVAVISVQLGQGSAVYAKPFADPKAVVAASRAARMRVARMAFPFRALHMKVALSEKHPVPSPRPKAGERGAG